MCLEFVDLTSGDIELIEKAKGLEKRRSKISSVAAVLKTSNSRIFSGVNIYIEGSEPCSICAEYSAIGTMVTEGEKEIETIVAVSLNKDKFKILPPCGKCRQFISEFGNPYVIVEANEKICKTKLSELYPLPIISE